MNIGIKQSNEIDFIGSGFFIKDDSFHGLVRKVKDKRMVVQKINYVFSRKRITKLPMTHNFCDITFRNLLSHNFCDITSRNLFKKFINEILQF